MKTPVIEIERLVYGGEGMGRLDDGRAVFVPFTLPGERVRIRVTEEKRRYARAALLEVLEASPARIEPKCPLFGRCGGCHYQHLPYDAQTRLKAELLRDQLARIGKIPSPPEVRVFPAPNAWAYRNHVQYHVDDSGALGFVAHRSEEVLPVPRCFLSEEPIEAFRENLHFEPESGVTRVSLRKGAADSLMLILETADGALPEMTLEAGISVVHVSGGDAVVMAGETFLPMDVNGRVFRVSAPSFFQVNTAMAEKMVSYLLETLPLSPETTLLDVYCGVGLFSAFFAPRVGRLIGIESSAAACEDFAANLDEFDSVELYEAPAEIALPALEANPDVAVVDPPRAGLDRRALDALIRLAPSILAYVSCDPSTLARDAARLSKGGYRLESLAFFDLFPQTYHIETISIFRR
jgi:23S rRNA (uracil1939-C5)-methyltransferase